MKRYACALSKIYTLGRPSARKIPAPAPRRVLDAGAGGGIRRLEDNARLAEAMLK
ncbi:hypothetical protein KCP74_21490 [Salmonella enterica subsp. enterica]|nr:hypothetical protein KCP74_21490 [Salmonella enterica subsp. enterica]